MKQASSSLSMNEDTPTLDSLRDNLQSVFTRDLRGAATDESILSHVWTIPTKRTDRGLHFSISTTRVNVLAAL